MLAFITSVYFPSEYFFVYAQRTPHRVSFRSLPTTLVTKNYLFHIKFPTRSGSSVCDSPVSKWFPSILSASVTFCLSSHRNIVFVFLSGGFLGISLNQSHPYFCKCVWKHFVYRTDLINDTGWYVFMCDTINVGCRDPRERKVPGFRRWSRKVSRLIMNDCDGREGK